MTLFDSMDVSIASGSEQLALFCSTISAKDWNVHFDAYEDTQAENRLPNHWKSSFKSSGVFKRLSLTNTGVTPEKRLLQAHLRSKEAGRGSCAMPAPSRNHSKEFWASQSPSFLSTPQPAPYQADLAALDMSFLPDQQAIADLMFGQAGILSANAWSETNPPSPDVGNQLSPSLFTDTDSDATCDESWLSASPISMFFNETSLASLDPYPEDIIDRKPNVLSLSSGEFGCATPPLDLYLSDMGSNFAADLTTDSMSFMDRSVDLTLADISS
eukprot:Ihof_evm12s110 gene=Ihof_evmTU12s110